MSAEKIRKASVDDPNFKPDKVKQLASEDEKILYVAELRRRGKSAAEVYTYRISPF
jgi:hypothetical protein